ncbi:MULTISPECIES: MurR/RpiR family transcriptional regulator [unclassified Oceanobacter]|jgi:DNA-binding MurR/RpiR family transcriptional regulator|uniref:MurR/RpiR family transcriptional regulator n=1 Tax=unclassified Oceanobacter TaxID=2620260 RepID=UPI0026E328D4|nr:MULTISPECIES: MurR/RpiR family transcriptional regulator [unclassified Oceanobacter]MDO6683719.1 MurR/RpiR family transcriptional regulator [Oceanobacter sp. 5_MG-2023]MDP2609945.1 MurR/RpiR family transcriptional regulator [Oceanobacter sp. 1_MG-2023]MDP2613173.1 MurR/RpiR family transcriptional regulator [Oceanobacter sp. 2_MG-2023]
MTAQPGVNGTVSQRIRALRDRLPPAELAVANSISENYPMGGLVPVVQLAASSGASPPTVVRFVKKLGFDGYSEFQDALRNEAQNRLFSPVGSYPDNRSSSDETSPSGQAQFLYLESIRNTFTSLSDAEITKAVQLLCASENNIVTIGGRFSQVLAQQLYRYLSILRPNVQLSVPDIHSLVDIQPSTVAVVFDFRRYQQTTINWGLEAINKGAKVILVTDQYLSPLASKATALLTAGNKALEPFDSMTAAFAVTELLISETARTLGEPARDRLEEFVQRQDDEDRLTLKFEPPAV